MSDWLNTAQAAKKSGKHPVTVRRAWLAGRLHGHQACEGGRLSFKPEAVDAWIQRLDSHAACGCQKLRLAQRRAS